MYNDIILDHFQNPRNLRELKKPTTTGMGASRTCGDVMTLYLDVEKHLIKEATFTTIGCGAAIAAGSVITELLKGKTIDEAREITTGALIEALGGLPKIKLHCPDLVMEALKSALDKYDKKHPQRHPRMS